MMITSKKAIYNYIIRGNYKYPLVPFGQKNTPPDPSHLLGNTPMCDDVRETTHLLGDLYKSNRPKIFCSLGRDISDNKMVIGDFHKVRQLLISGLQGSGKSNSLTYIMLSMLFGNHPLALDLRIFDIKREFSFFEGVAKTYVKKEEMTKGVDELKKIMKRRYAILQQSKERNIADYNALQINIGGEIMKYIVVVVDEYASTASRIENFNEDFERLANMGRACGIYLIISTQSADRESLSPKIKRNIFCNLVFAQRDEHAARIAGVENAHHIDAIGEVGTAICDINRKRRVVHFAEIKTKELKNAIARIKKFFSAPSRQGWTGLS